MRLRFTSVDEYQFLTCVKNEVWGSKSSRFKDWQKGDLLAVVVEKQIAGLGEVSGEPYKSDKIVWDNGLFPYRIPIKFKYLFDEQHRPPVLGKIRDVLANVWGGITSYGWGILNQVPLDPVNSDIVINEIIAKAPQNSTIIENLEALLLEAKQARVEAAIKKHARERKRSPKKENIAEIITPPELVVEKEPLTNTEESLHSKAQYILSKIGQISRCNIFIASNDRKRKYKSVELGSLTLPTLPHLGLSKDASDRISRIDVIWLKGNQAICAFEVETSTSVYSGLLRMSDLLSVIPNLKIKLYIVAQKERENKVLSELSRPTFRRIGLSDYCEFISIEDLESLLSKIENLSGHVQPSILDTVALGLPDESEAGDDA